MNISWKPLLFFVKMLISSYAELPSKSPVNFKWRLSRVLKDNIWKFDAMNCRHTKDFELEVNVFLFVVSHKSYFFFETVSMPGTVRAVR